MAICRLHRFDGAQHRLDGLIPSHMIVHVEVEFLGLFKNPEDIVFFAISVVSGNSIKALIALCVCPTGPCAALPCRAVNKKLETGKMHKFCIHACGAVTLYVVQTKEGICIVDSKGERVFVFQFPAKLCPHGSPHWPAHQLDDGCVAHTRPFLHEGGGPWFNRNVLNPWEYGNIPDYCARGLPEHSGRLAIMFNDLSARRIRS